MKFEGGISKVMSGGPDQKTTSIDHSEIQQHYDMTSMNSSITVPAVSMSVNTGNYASQMTSLTNSKQKNY